MIDDSGKRKFYAVRHEDDHPNTARGLLIPPLKQAKKKSFISSHFTPLLTFPALLVFILFGLGVFSVGAVASFNTASVTQMSIVNPFTSAVEPLNYGVQIALSEPNFYQETREAFIDNQLTFVDVDLIEMKLRYFEEGVLKQMSDILSKGKNGSWCQTPSGIYKVESKKKNHFSGLGQVYQPWSFSFQSNFFIHGQPTYANDEMVTNDFTGDCIRLKDQAAEELFDLVRINTPVLVHEENMNTSDFLYEPKIPDMKTPHYLIADIESSTVLAASDLDIVASIASLTKLMTAVVMTENINLDKNVSVTKPTFVQSLIPRLQERKQVSMYSLLQLLLVESSNEAAEVIASEFGRDKFIDLMNRKAVEIGMNNTHFIDPSGLGAENTSTLSDLLRLTRYIYTNKKFIFEITANQDLSTAYVKDEFGKLENFNEISGNDNFIGGKVGETRAAGQTSISLHHLTVKGTKRVVAIIILGSEGRNDDVKRLLRHAEESFSN
ncbi:MAG: L,D-transpeptidase family protein [Candidatus Paceibacterota bacterium]